MMGRGLRCAVTWLMTSAVMATAAEPAAEPPIAVRRVYVPAEVDVARWPLQNVPYLPMEPAEFERLLAAARQSGGAAQPSSQSALVELQMYGRCEGAVVITGTGRMSVRGAGASPFVVPLGSPTYTIVEPKWSDDERPAVLGVEASGQITLYADRNGSVDFKWSQSVARDSLDVPALTMRLPQSPAVRLTLETPDGIDLQAVGGMRDAPQAGSAAGLRRWTIQTGGGDLRLRFQPAGNGRAAVSPATVRQNLHYELSERGVELTAELRIDAIPLPLDTLDVVVDAGLTLVDVSVVDRRAVWTAPAGNQRTVTITFDKPLHGTARSVLLRAIAPIAVGSRSRLPTLRTSGLFWQQGTMTLAVPAPLRIDRLDVSSGVASPPVPLTGGRSGLAYEVQCFDAATAVEAVIARATETARLTAVTAFKLAPRETTAVMQGRFQIAGGETFTLDANIPSRWIIDSVTAQPAAALDDWSIVEMKDKRRRLTLHLAQALKSDRPLQLTITAHAKQSTIDRNLSRDDLRIVEFLGVRDDGSLAAVHADPSLRIDVEYSEESSAPTAEALDPVRRELLGEFDFDGLVDLSNAASPWKMAVTRRRPRYDARTQLEVVLDEEGLQERYRIEVKNRETLPIERLVVRVRPAKPGAMHWTIGDEMRGRLQARRLPATDPAMDAEDWELLLRRPAAGDLVLHARRQTPVAEAHDLSPAAVAEAVEQRGTLIVRGGPSVPLQLKPRSLTPQPAEPDRSTDRPPIRASYLYDPQQLFEAVPPVLAVSRPADAATSPCGVVWDIEVSSAFESDGQIRNFARLDVQAFEAGACKLTFPSDAFDRRVAIDGREIEAAGIEAIVEFPRERRFFSIDVKFSTPPQPRSPIREVSLPRLRIDLPLLHEARYVAVPSAYDLPIDTGYESLLERSQSSWMRRIAGPLAQADAPRLEIWGADLSGLGRRPTAASAERLVAVNAAVGVAARGFVAVGNGTWESFWAKVVGQRPPEAAALWFDGPSLRRAGRGPHDRFVVASFGGELSDAACGEQFLWASGVYLSDDERGITVTARPRSSDRDVLRVFRSTTEIAAGEQTLPLEFAAWRLEPKSVWTTAASADDDVGELAGGIAVRPAATGVWAVRRETPTAVATALVLIAFAFGRLILPTRRTLCGLLMIVSGTAAFVLPTWLSVAATSVLLGLLIASGLELVVPRRRRSRTTGLGVAVGPTPSSADRGRAMLKGSLSSLLLALAVDARGADVAPSSGGGGTSDVYEVLIPSDADKKPTGGRYQVPEPLVRLLEQRIADQGGTQARPAVFRRAEYTAVLARDAEQKRYVAVELKAIIEGQTFQPATTVTIPFEPGRTTTVGTTLLDGRLIDARRDAAGLSFEVVAAGPFRFQFSFRPQMLSDRGKSGFSMSVPAMPDAVVTIVAPPDVGLLEVPSAAEPIRYGDEQRPTMVRLAPTSQLSVSWHDEPQAPGTSGVVEQLMWLNVRPGSTVVDARFRVRPSRPMRELVLRADPRLQWLPKRSDRSPVSDVVTAPITVDQATVAERLTIVLDKPITEETVIDVSFLLTGSRGVGRVRIPALQPDDRPAGRRCFAYSVDPLLDATVTGGSATTALAVPEFVRLWGGTEPLLPQASYELQSGESDWVLASRPAAARVESVARQTVICGRRQIDLHWQADTAVERGVVSRYELQVPTSVEIESVEVTEVGGDGGGQALGWSRDDKGMVIVALRAPLGGKHHLELRGRSTSLAGGTAALPIVQLRCDVVRQNSILVVRRFDTLVTLEKPTDLSTVAELRADDPSVAGTRTVVDLRVSGAAPAALLRIAPNPRQFTAQCLTTLRADGAEWDCEFTARLNVAAGLLDEIVLEMPPEIAMPLAVSPAMSYEVSTDNAASRRVVLRPRSSISGEFQFSVRATLTRRRTEDPVPIIRFKQREAGEYFLRLPGAVGVNPVRWETEQLAPAPAPAAIAGGAPSEQSVVLRVVGAKPRAVLRTVSGASGRPFIRLADHRIAIDADGGYFGVSSYLVEPAGLKSLTLRLPEGVETAAQYVAGSFTTLLRGDGGLYRLNLASDQMPQLVDVVFRRPAPASGRLTAATIAVPRPEEILIERTIWTIAQPKDAHLEPSGALAGSPIRIESERLATLDASLVDLHLQGGLDTTAAWSMPLLGRRDRARQELLRLSAPQSQADRRELDRLLAESDRRTADWRSEETDAALRGVDADVDRLWQDAASPYADILCVVTSDGQSELSVRSGVQGRAALQRFIAIVIGLSVLGIWRLLMFVDGGLRWPQLFAMLAGIAWIVWLRPAFIGWIIVAAVIACRWHPSLRRARSQRTAFSRPLAVNR